MSLNTIQKEKKDFLKRVKFSKEVESFLKDQYKKQCEFDKKIGKETAKKPIKMDNFMVDEKAHELFKERFFTTTKLNTFMVDFHKNNFNEDCKFGTTFYYIYYGFDLYNPAKLKKIALLFRPDKKLIPFATHGHSEIEGGLCFDYSENENEPAILYTHVKSDKMVTVAENFEELIK